MQATIIEARPDGHGRLRAKAGHIRERRPWAWWSRHGEGLPGCPADAAADGQEGAVVIGAEGPVVAHADDLAIADAVATDQPLVAPAGTRGALPAGSVPAQRQDADIGAADDPGGRIIPGDDVERASR